jgi:photosystem II stability/assembly factor-like uncharacterized protein
MSTRDRVVLVAITLLVVAVLGFLAFRWGDSGAAPAAEGAELEHVHGLGVDPGNDTLYAGTHYGLFRLPEQGDGTRVADRIQDFMGFTVAGPDHFLASGHPGEGQDGPSSLGLIESTDGGRTWQSLSLAGEADFHALEYRHGQVYGVNSLTAQFMVSDDKENWETRSTLPMADFAVSPDNPDVILATTERGLSRSEDGGRTFGLVRGAPLLLLVTWAADGAIAGVGPEGNVHVSSDGGGSWEQRGLLDGPPEALAAQSRGEIYAAAGGAVLASTNGGRDFTVRYRD